jgi:hypothetical protein
VGEVRDSIINLFSGGLGIGLIWFMGTRDNQKDSVNIFHLKTIIGSFGVTTVLMALFLLKVHGFGRIIENTDPGRIYSSFSQRGLSRINRQESEMSPGELKLYDDEALRHLFQREYYFTNEYVASDGVTYKIYSQCFFENRVLEVYYKRFLNKHANESSGPLISHIGNEVAGKVMQNPVMWSDSLRQNINKLAGKENRLFSSRVKSTLIVSFKMKDLIFYCIMIFLLLGYFWFLICKIETNPTDL